MDGTTAFALPRAVSEANQIMVIYPFQGVFQPDLENRGTIIRWPPGLLHAGDALCWKFQLLPAEANVRKSISILAALLLCGASGLALAHNCPNEMKAIDARLSSKPALSPENSAKVTKLRADGEAYHKAGKHDEAMKSLLEAKKILGI